jgi:phospholipase/lecithinase/hemolysin
MRVNEIEEVYFFGDSLTDGGLGACGIYELSGRTIPPSPPYHRGCWCDGPIWVERFTQEMDVRYDPSHNYAVGGANTDTSNVAEIGHEMLRGTGILAQVQRCLAANVSTDTKRLCAIWAGGNDISDGRIPMEEVVSRAVVNTEQCIRLLTEGGICSILVITYPNMGYNPRARTQGTEVVWDRLSRDLATSMARLVAELRGQVPTTLIRGDIFRLHEEVIADPEKYGFSNITSPCLSPAIGQAAGDPSEYLYWDDAHFTAAFHALVADWLADAVRDGLG